MADQLFMVKRITDGAVVDFRVTKKGGMFFFFRAAGRIKSTFSRSHAQCVAALLNCIPDNTGKIIIEEAQ
jgi:hypothetical protein